MSKSAEGSVIAPRTHDRYLCMIGTCSWTYETPSQPTRRELERALVIGEAEVARERALRIDSALREHFETHTLEQWVTAAVGQRRRAEAAERELSETRERIAAEVRAHPDPSDALQEDGSEEDGHA